MRPRPSTSGVLAIRRLLAGVTLLAAVSCARMPWAPRGAVLHYCNPLDVSIADPDVLKDGNSYYLYGTTDSAKGLEVFSSGDLVNWRRRGYCLRKTPNSWAQDNFWAPECIRKGDTYYLFYTGFNPAAHIRSVCVAVSRSPVGPFKDVATPLLPDGRGYIDGSPFFDEASGRHFVYLMEENRRPPRIVVTRLAPDLLSVETTPTVCFEPDQRWERGWVEGPFVIKRGATYYMMYSGCGYASPNYSVGYATAPSPMGPWTKYAHNPILKRTPPQGTPRVSGPGHNSVAASPDGKELFIAYHTHVPPRREGWQRQLAIDRLRFAPDAEGGPDFLTVAAGRTDRTGPTGPISPTDTRQPLPSGARPMRFAASDSFSSGGSGRAGDLDRTRWVIFGEDAEKWRFENGALQIDTQDGDLWTNRVDAKNIFLQYAPPGDFTIQTKVHFVPQANFEQAFLIVWQDQSNYLKIASVFSGGRKIEIAREINGAFESANVDNSVGDDVYLQIEKTGSHYTLSFSADGKRWTPIGNGYDAAFEEIKVGIGAFAPASKAQRTAAFGFFTISTGG